MVLAGDNMESLPPERQTLLSRLLPPTGQAARFDDTSCRVGRISFPDRLELCLLNWSDESDDVVVAQPGTYHISDFWTGEDLGGRSGLAQVKGLPPHSTRLLVASLQ